MSGHDARKCLEGMGVIERRRGTDTGAVFFWSIWGAPFPRRPQHDATQALKRVEPRMVGM
jgi:hypothetical protein